MKVKINAKAFLPSYYSLEQVASGTVLPAISAVDSEYFKQQGYPFIGNVVVEIELESEDVIVAAQINAMQSHLEAMRAEHHRQQQAILDHIGRLQAITYTPA